MSDIRVEFVVEPELPGGRRAFVIDDDVEPGCRRVRAYISERHALADLRGTLELLAEQFTALSTACYQPIDRAS